MVFRGKHPKASVWSASLPSQVSKKLLTTVHPDYRKILGKWSLVSIEAKGEVPDFELEDGENQVLIRLRRPVAEK